MLQLASVFTAGFAFSELAALTDLADSELLDCVEEALAEELLHPLSAERYTFAHALVRQTLYEQMSSSRRTRLHRRLAGVLELLNANNLTRVAGELVSQYHASATLAGAARGAIYAVDASRAARAAYAPEDAIVTLRQGMDLVSPEADDTRGRLLSEMALAQAEAGFIPDARRTLEAAVPLLEQRSNGDELIAELVYAVGNMLWVAPTEMLAIAPLIAPWPGHG
jgi:predicted ATPase